MDDNFFKWQPEKFSIGVAVMDSEHERLISIMNNLYRKYINNEGKAELMKIIKQLGDFVVMHFKHEEDYFMKIPNYIYKDAHKSLHTQLINKFTDHVNAFEKSGVLKEDFFDFLKLWLSGHIMGIDMNYGKGLKISNLYFFYKISHSESSDSSLSFSVNPFRNEQRLDLSLNQADEWNNIG